MSDEAPKILVVDDSPQVCKALGDVLKASGYVARTAPSAERALQIIEADHFDLVITDLKMSGMNGMDLAKKIFELMPGVPVVILTGFGDMDGVIAALRSGVADFLKKPFSIDEVLSVVKRELAKSRPQPPTIIPTRSASMPERPPRVYIFGQRDLEQIDVVLSRLRAQAGADSALLVEEAGYVIAAKGLVNSVELDTISNLIAGARSSSASLASLLGESQDFSTSYMEGQKVSVYNTALGRGLYLVVIVPKGTRQGLVWLYAKESAVEIERIVRRATEAMQKQVGHSIGAADTEALHREMADQAVENVFERKPAAPPFPRPANPPRSSIRPLGTISTISFKKDRSTPDVVATPILAKIAEPPAPPPIEPAAPPEPAAPAGPALSFEDALKLGLVNFDGVPPIETPEPAALESSAELAGSALSPDTFAAALNNGLLNFDTETPVEPPPDQGESTLSPDSFAEALKRGLFG